MTKIKLSPLLTARVARAAMILMVALLTALLFVGGSEGSHRVSRAIWNLGHVPLFAAIVWLVLDRMNAGTQQWLRICTLTTVLTVLLGLLVELLQLATDRSFSWNDIRGCQHCGCELYPDAVGARPAKDGNTSQGLCPAVYRAPQRAHFRDESVP